MKNFGYNHRCKELDAVIDKNVRIIFKNDSWIEGVLFWNTTSKAPLYLEPDSYYLVENNSKYWRIFKTNVKKIVEIE